MQFVSSNFLCSIFHCKSVGGCMAAFFHILLGNIKDGKPYSNNLFTKTKLKHKSSTYKIDIFLEVLSELYIHELRIYTFLNWCRQYTFFFSCLYVPAETKWITESIIINDLYAGIEVIFVWPKNRIEKET